MIKVYFTTRKIGLVETVVSSVEVETVEAFLVGMHEKLTSDPELLLLEVAIPSNKEDPRPPRILQSVN